MNSSASSNGGSAAAHPQGSVTLVGAPVFGTEITFAVTSRDEFPEVQARCFQDDLLVYEEWHGFWADAPGGTTFTLGPTPSWTGGAASCIAEMGTWKTSRFHPEDRIEFEASAG